MKKAIASLSRDIQSEISPQGGRAPYYLIFKNNNLIEVWKNIFNIGGGGAGLAVSKVLNDKGVKLIISGHFGDKMKEALNDRNIKFEEKNGIIKDIL